MVDTAALSLHLDAAPAPIERRPRVLLVGTAFASAAVAVAYLTMFAVYIDVRADVLANGLSWLPEGSTIPLAPGNMTAVTLAMSLVTVQWAVWSGAQKDRGHAYLAIGVTLLLGSAHLVQMAYLMTEWSVPLNGEGTSTAAVLLFAMVGGQMALHAIGMIFLALMGVRSLGGQFTGRDAEGLSAAALYWWVTVGLYTVIWYAVLIVK